MRIERPPGNWAPEILRGSFKTRKLGRTSSPAEPQPRQVVCSANIREKSNADLNYQYNHCKGRGPRAGLAEAPSKSGCQEGSGVRAESTFGRYYPRVVLENFRGIVTSSCSAGT